MLALDILKAVILGIVEGLTEFIPVSSTGHLILVSTYLQFKSINIETFNIAIQLGAILAVLVLYRKFFIKILFKKRWFSRDMNNIIIAIIPAFIFGFALHSFIKEHLFTPFTVALGLILGSIIMIGADFFIKKKKVKTYSLAAITPKQALFIGCFQCLSLWPGVSRSGATITGALFGRLSYKASAQFSFIIAVPVICAAVLFDLISSASMLTVKDFLFIGLGFSISFLLSIFSIIIFLKLLKKLKLLPFAVYRLILAVIVILFTNQR